MDRLIEGVGENSPESYDAIYLTRKENGVDAFDLKRWTKLLKHYRGGKLIDVGTLDSLVPVLALESYPNAEVWGIDVASEAVSDMQKRYPDVRYKVEDGYNTHFPSNYFDYVVVGEVIEHLNDPIRFIQESFRILKRGGFLALSTPENEARERGAIDAHRHVWSYTQESIRLLLEQYGTVTIKSMGSQFWPKYIYHWPVILAFCRKT